jgi:hypothetical protein
MGKGSKAPAAPDAYETAAAEAQFNRPDTYSPAGGGIVNGYTDSNGQFVQGVAPKGAQSAVKTIESPWEKALREMLQPASQALTGRIIDDNITNLPDAARVGDRGTVAQSIFDRNLSMMMPSIDKSNSRLIENLQARGIPVGGEAFNDAYGEQQRQTQDTISRLAQDADINAGNEQSRLFGLDSAARSGAISELVAAMGGGYNPPNNAPSSSVPGVNYSGLVGQQYQNQMAQYQQDQANKNTTMGTLGSVAGAMLMKCTEKAKNIEGPISLHEVASSVLELPLHAWRYKAEAAPEGHSTELHLGPMAEDFHRVFGLGDGETISVIDAFGVTFSALKSALMRLEVLERRHYGEALN